MTPNPNAFHLFLSYARADNRAPVNQAGEGWVKAFKHELERRHAAYSGRELRVFFDEQDIHIGVDWRRRLGEGLRQSRLFLAFLSPNYLISDNCQWEWDEYLRREHSAARGDDGITPVYFVTPGDLRLKEVQSIAEWLTAIEAKYPWFKARSFKPEAERTARRMAEDLTGRRNKSTHLELQPWYEHGPEVLRELDAAARSAEVKAQSRDSAADLRTLAERLDGLDRHIAQRLDRLALADLAPGNIGRSHEHFVGRHAELRQLHDILLKGGPQSGGRGMGGRGIIAATFAPGGLGKTALARQYAHAYAEWYAAGGTWEIGCEGVTELGLAVQKLAESARFKELALRDRSRAATTSDDYLTAPLQLSEVQRANPALALEAVLAYLKRATFARRDVLLDELTRKMHAGEAERHSNPEDPPELKAPRALLLLDNVDQKQLLSASQLGLLPAEEWLEIVVTTRLDPKDFGGGDKVFAHLEVGVLPDADALQLLADFQPFASEAEEQAARQIVQTLAGWTLALEIVAALIAHHAKAGHPRPVQALYQELQQKGLAWVDALAGTPGVDGHIRHSDQAHLNRIGTLIGWSMARLSPPARTALEYASLLMPDRIPLVWLRELTAQRHPEVNDISLANPYSWLAVWGELRGLRLLHPALEASSDDRGVEAMPELVRIHRLVAEHVRGAGLPRHFAEVDRFFYALCSAFEYQVGKAEDAAQRVQQPWLRDQLAHLISAHSAHPPTSTLLRSTGIVASFEGNHGLLSRALRIFERLLAAQERLRTANPNSLELQRDVSVCLEKLGDFLSRRRGRGDTEQALFYYQRSLDISERIANALIYSTQGQRDVAFGLERLADALIRRGLPGDADRALACYQRSLEIRERLFTASPNFEQAQRDLSLSLDSLGTYLQSRGLLEQGIKYCERNLQICERLARANPNSGRDQRALSIALNSLGHVLSRRGLAGDAEQALVHHKRSLEIRERISTESSNSTQGRRDVAISLTRLGDFLTERSLPGDEDKALEYYQRSLEMHERLAKDDPNNAQAKSDLCASLNRFSHSLTARGLPGDFENALKHQQQSVLLSKFIADDDPSSVQSMRDFAVSLGRLGSLLSRRGFPGDSEQALENYRRCNQVLERLAAAEPGDQDVQHDLCMSLEGTAAYFARQVEGANAALDLQTRALGIALALRQSNPQSLYFGRTAAVSLSLAAQYADAAGQANQAGRYRYDCFQVLDELLKAGCTLDAWMKNTHARLKPTFDNP